MQSKLQQKDIARYSPFGLKFEVTNINNTIPFETDNAELICREYITFKKNADWYFNSDENETEVKPLLHAPNLATPITIKGKTITPLLELAKIAFPNKLWAFDELNNLTSSGFIFGFNKKQNSFWIDSESGIMYTAPFQSALFDWLDEHFIDYRGLIQNGLAVDVTTLKDNPYA